MNKNGILLNRSELLEDGLAVQSFLEGVALKFKVKNKTFARYLNQLGKFNQSLLGQIIISQESIKQPYGALESFDYFQFPNPLVGQAIVELLLRKQSNSKGGRRKQSKSSENEQEKIVVSMDTESMGKVVIIVVVMGFRVWCTFHTDKDSAASHVTAFRQELSNNLEKYQFKLEEFKSVRKKVNIKKFISPSQDLGDVKRIETEI